MAPLGTEKRADERGREMQTLHLRVALAIDRGMPANGPGSGGSPTSGDDVGLGRVRG
jgi:hypothetical protein